MIIDTTVHKQMRQSSHCKTNDDNFGYYWGPFGDFKGRFGKAILTLCTKWLPVYPCRRPVLNNKLKVVKCKNLYFNCISIVPVYLSCIIYLLLPFSYPVRNTFGTVTEIDNLTQARHFKQWGWRT